MDRLQKFVSNIMSEKDKNIRSYRQFHYCNNEKQDSRISTKSKNSSKT